MEPIEWSEWATRENNNFFFQSVSLAMSNSQDVLFQLCVFFVCIYLYTCVPFILSRTLFFIRFISWIVIVGLHVIHSYVLDSIAKLRWLSGMFPCAPFLVSFPLTHCGPLTYMLCMIHSDSVRMCFVAGAIEQNYKICALAGGITQKKIILLSTAIDALQPRNQSVSLRFCFMSWHVLCVFFIICALCTRNLVSLSANYHVLRPLNGF